MRPVSFKPLPLFRPRISMMRPPVLAALILGVLATGLGGCGVVGEADPELTATRSQERYDRTGRVTGEDGFVIFGDGQSRKGEDEGGGIGVNSFLWRASLDTISFMPVSSADPFGGVVITDWHSTSGATNERFKMNVYILGRALRADGVRVAVFRQVLNQGGAWVDAPIADGAATKIEDSILTRARQLRNQSLLQE